MSGFSGARVATIAALAAGALVLTACGGDQPESPPGPGTSTTGATAAPVDGGTDEQKAALDAYADLEMAQRAAVLETYADLYADFTIEAVYPNTIVYTYTYLEPIDPDEAASAFSEVAAMLDDQVTGSVFPAMEDTGVESPQAKFVYLNPDGSEIWSHLVESS